MVNAGAAGSRRASINDRVVSLKLTTNLWYIFESLKALTQNDAALLCGRADVIRGIVDNCRAERLTVLTSEPGLGVTSVLQAGVLPALQRRGFIVACFSDWQGRFFCQQPEGSDRQRGAGADRPALPRAG